MTWFNWFGKNTDQGEHKITSEDVRQIVSDFNKWLPRIQGIPEVLEEITFDEAISYFQSDRPGNANVKKGAIIRQEHPEGQLLGQVFLDGNNRLICRTNGTPYGRQLLAKKSDKKLTDFFGDRELIAFELKAQESGGYEFPLPQNIVLEFGEWLRNVVKLPEVIPIITYEDTIKYFITYRPNDPRIRKGAILRETHPQGYHLAQVFLDKNNQVVLSSNGVAYGRQLVARELDDELLEVFGNKKLIIVE
ncbi:hypothetical protein [Aerosakkonema funiforme]|uniref:hypothetical protein n=1 Tax=Aerosakkonema funiforme TaxID=1246630 RepID=UPI0035B8A583